MIPLLLSVLLAGGDLVAIRVRRAESVAQGPIEHAVILIEDGKIVEIGQDLPIERGIRVIDRPDWVATPGLVNAHTRVGGERWGGRAFEPHARPDVEIDPEDDVWEELLELGVTTLGYYPSGSGIPGQSIVLRPHGETFAEMLVTAPAYLKIFLQANVASKKAVRDAFDKVDEYLEKVAKEREKWEKEQEKKKKSSKSSGSKSDDKKEEKKDDKKEEPKKDEEKKGSLPQEEDKDKEKEKDAKEAKKDEGDGFVPPTPDEKVKPFLDLREKRLTAMLSIFKAADYLHVLDVLEDEKDVKWFVEFPLANDADLYEIVAKLGEKKLLVVTEPDITLQVNSLKVRNVPAELARAGAKLVLGPRVDTLDGHRDWMPDVGRLVGQGLAREAALAAVTLEPARALGLEASLGSLEKDKTANIVLWSGDPFEPTSKVEAVMLEGRFVVGEEK